MIYQVRLANGWGDHVDYLVESDSSLEAKSAALADADDGTSRAYHLKCDEVESVRENPKRADGIIQIDIQDHEDPYA